MKTNANRPAFPDIISINRNDGNGLVKEKCQGLTKREYFAAMALQGLLTTCSATGNSMPPNLQSVAYLSDLAVTAADELLKSLDKHQP